MIPDYQSLMLPLLKFISDGKDHSTKDAVDFLGKEFNLSDDDLNEWLPSKKQKTFVLANLPDLAARLAPVVIVSSISFKKVPLSFALAKV